MDGTAVLVVEDQPDLRALLGLILEEVPGVHSFLAEDGEQAVLLAQAIKPALVLLDMSLPKLDGFGVLSRLKADPATATIPVIAVTALANLRPAACQAGCVAFVEKPFDLASLLTTVRRYLSGPAVPPAPVVQTSICAV